MHMWVYFLNDHKAGASEFIVHAPAFRLGSCPNPQESLARFPYQVAHVTDRIGGRVPGSRCQWSPPSALAKTWPLLVPTYTPSRSRPSVSSPSR